MDSIKSVFSKSKINYTKIRNFSLAKTRSIIEQDLISDYREYDEYNALAFSDLAFYGTNKISAYKFMKEEETSKFSSFNNTNGVIYTPNSRVLDSSRRLYIYEKIYKIFMKG